MASFLRARAESTGRSLLMLQLDIFLFISAHQSRQKIENRLHLNLVSRAHERAEQHSFDRRYTHLLQLAACAAADRSARQRGKSASAVRDTHGRSGFVRNGSISRDEVLEKGGLLQQPRP